jgi:hypothetical protein
MTQLDGVLLGNDKIPFLVKTGNTAATWSSFSFTFYVNDIRKHYFWACATGLAGVDQLVCYDRHVLLKVPTWRRVSGKF